MQEVEPGLFYALVEVNTPGFNPSDLLTPIFDRTKNVFMLSVNDVKKKSLGYYPFTLSFTEPNSLYRFYNGDFFFMILVDIDAVNKRVADNQLEVHLTQDDSHPMQVVSKIPIDNFDGSYIGFHIIGRLAAEFIRLDWFVENIVLMENDLPDRFGGISLA